MRSKVISEGGTCGMVNVFIKLHFIRGHAVARLFEALRLKPESRGVDSRWCHWNFSLT